MWDDMEDKCGRCGRTSRWKAMYFIDGEWWCRDCMWQEYSYDATVNFILLHKEDFSESYPEGFDYLWDVLEGKDHDREDDRIQEYISDRLEDYVEWVLGNPTIIPVKKIRARWKEKE